MQRPSKEQVAEHAIQQRLVEVDRADDRLGCGERALLGYDPISSRATAYGISAGIKPTVCGSLSSLWLMNVMVAARAMRMPAMLKTLMAALIPCFARRERGRTLSDRSPSRRTQVHSLR